MASVRVILVTYLTTALFIASAVQAAPVESPPSVLLTQQKAILSTTTEVPDMEVEVTTQFSDESTPLGNSTMGGPDNNSTLASGGEDVVKAVKDSNKTVIIVALLFVFTMVCKGFPVVVAYLLPHCSKETPEGAGDATAEPTAEEYMEEGIEVEVKTPNCIPLPEYKTEEEKKEKIPMEEYIETAINTDKDNNKQCERL